MNESPKNRPEILSIFLFAVLGAVELMTLLSLLDLHILPRAWLLLLAGVLGLLTLGLYRLLFKGRRCVGVRRFFGCVLSMCLVAACLTGAFTAYLLGDMFDSVVDASIGTDLAQPDDPTEQPFAVYLSGSDTRSSDLTKSRSDVNIVAVVNPEDKQVLLVNTPRDYYVSNPAGNGAGDKLTHCGLYGPANSAQALSELYGVPIAYTAQINFKGFETLIDAMGGITVTSDYAFTTTVGKYKILAGENTLTGAQALAFARERSHLKDGDNGRGRNQMEVISGMIDALTAGNLLANYRTVLNSLEGMFTTSMPSSTMARLIRMQLTDMASWEVFSYAVTGTDGTGTAWSSGSTKLYVMYPDGASVAKAAVLMETVLAGELLTAEDITA